MSRNFEDWLAAYVAYVHNTEPPELFKCWVGISTIASALQRKCWIEMEKDIYPNMYIVLVAPSGIRKGTAMEPAFRLLVDLEVPIAPESLTREVFVRRLSTVQEDVLLPDGTTITQSPFTIFSKELVVLLNDSTKQLIRDLADLYDCSGPTWSYETISRGINAVNAPWVNLIGATTPQLLREALPREAVGGGFASRVIFVYGPQKSKLVPWPERTAAEEEVRTLLLEDLFEIHSMAGKFSFGPDFRDHYVAWYVAQEQLLERVTPKFEAYWSRRATHLRKLSMILSASRNNELVITAEDFEDALQLLERTEANMGHVLGGLGRINYASVLPRVLAFVQTQGTTTEKELLQRFYEDLSCVEMGEVLRLLQRTGYAEVERGPAGRQITWKGQHYGQITEPSPTEE